MYFTYGKYNLKILNKGNYKFFVVKVAKEKVGNNEYRQRLGEGFLWNKDMVVFY